MNIADSVTIGSLGTLHVYHVRVMIELVSQSRLRRTHATQLS